MNNENLQSPAIFETKYDVKNAKELEAKIHEEYETNDETEKILTVSNCLWFCYQLIQDDRYTGN